MIQDLDFEHDITIDKHALDLELLELSSLTLKYNRHLADCRLAMDKAKEKLEYTAATLVNKMRTNPQEYDLEKVTEGALRDKLLQSNLYQNQQEKTNAARYNYEIAQAASRAMQDKKTALENLVKLHGQNYFSSPNLPKQIDRDWEKVARQENVDKKIGKKMRRK